MEFLKKTGRYNFFLAKKGDYFLTLRAEWLGPVQNIFQKRKWELTWNGEEFQGRNKDLESAAKRKDGLLDEFSRLAVQQNFKPKKKRHSDEDIRKSLRSLYSSDGVEVFKIRNDGGWLNLVVITAHKRFWLGWNGERFADSSCSRSLPDDLRKTVKSVIKREELKNA